MILSNNPITYIGIAIYHKEYGTNIFHHKYIDEVYHIEYEIKIYKKYVYRWAGPSSVHTYTPRLGLWTKNGIKNF